MSLGLPSRVFPVRAASLSVLLCVLTLIQGQRTFMRTCDCEYVTNGKCAYTLLLPLGDSAPSTCSGGDGSGSDLQDIQNQVATIRENLTSLSDWSSSQARLLSQLQGFVLAIQAGVATPTIKVDDSTQAPEVDLTSRFSELQNEYRQVRDAMGAVQTNVNTLQARIATIERDSLDQIQTLTQQIQDLKRAKCIKKGLIVSGTQASISDDNITASSSFNDAHGPLRARINNTEAPGAWCPKEPNTDYEWIQFNLGVERWLYGTVLKGRHDFFQWVTSYRVEYATEAGDSSDVGDSTVTWTKINDVMDEPEIFVGNVDQRTAQTNLFWEPVYASSIRIIPLAGYRGANKCLRADVIGCLDDVS